MEITFWGIIDNEMIQEIFDLTPLMGGGCISQTCSHYSHGAWAPLWVLTPKEGVKVRKIDNEDLKEVFMVEAEDGRWVLTVKYLPNYWDKISIDPA